MWDLLNESGSCDFSTDMTVVSVSVVDTQQRLLCCASKQLIACCSEDRQEHRPSVGDDFGRSTGCSRIISEQLCVCVSCLSHLGSAAL